MTPGRVLVVDADPDARSAARRTLESSGWTVYEAADAEAAATAPVPDVLLIDPVLPDGGGEDLIAGSRAPVVISTGFDRYERPTLDRGARVFLRKPAEPRELAQAVHLAASAPSKAEVDASPASELPEAPLVALAPVVPPAPLAALAAENRARTGLLRAQAADAREHLLAGALLDAPTLRDQLGALTAWATGYYGVRRAFVLLLQRGQLHVLAECGGAPLYPEGAITDPVVHFDSEVISATAPLVIANAAAHPVFANHPAAEVSSFYAGAPLTTTGRVALGTLCVEDVNPTPFHAEDAQLLTAFGRMTGRLLEAVAHGGTPAPALFAASAVFASDALDALLAAELARATRGRSAMELAFISLREPLAPALADIAHDVARVGRRRFALAIDPHRLAIVCGDVTRDLVRRRVDHAVASFAWRHPIAAAGAASIDPTTRSAAGDLSPARLRAAALDMLELAGRSPAGPIQRIALA